MITFNQTTIAGNLTRDPELRFTNSGKPVCNFSVAVNNPRNSEDVDFFDVVAWEDLGETVANYKTKGDPVLIGGRLSQRQWEAQDGSKRSKVEIVANTVQFLSSPNSGSNGSAKSAEDAGQAAHVGAGGASISEDDFDDIPF